jgi:hypothetical protein
MQGTVTTRRKSFKNNALRKTRTIRLSQTFPLDGGTINHAILLTKTTSIRRRRRQETLTPKALTTLPRRCFGGGGWTPDHGLRANPFRVLLQPCCGFVAEMLRFKSLICNGVADVADFHTTYTIFPWIQM